ncbi:hypothetical protein BJ912DRAFT_1054528 [Pholiota molesta]|nr:hypothetical protein BJ912DRAFT_1054528 [Pholiota molesta]
MQRWITYPAIGDYYATIDLSHHEPEYHYDYEHYPHSYNLLDRRIFEPTPAFLIQFQLMFGVLHFGGDETTILLPRNCLAVGFAANLGTFVGKRNIFGTKKPIIFELNKKDSDPPSTIDTEVIYYSVPKAELDIHVVNFSDYMYQFNVL